MSTLLHKLIPDNTDKGVVGMSAIVLGNIPGCFPHDVEGWMRIASLAIGMFIAILTARSMWRNRNK